MAGAYRRLVGWEQLANGRVRHPFEPVILVLAVLVVPVVFMEESDPGATARTIAAIGNWIIWLGFTAELVFVLTVAPRKRAAVRAHWLDVAIVVLTVPVLPAALATLRLVRLLRLARLAALGARAVTAERLLVSRQNFRFIALVTAFIVVVAGAAISYADTEVENPWRGVWWAITTVTTVGYGDVVPTTVAGRIIASILMLVGIGFLSLLTAAIAARFVEDDAQSQTIEALARVEDRLARVENTLNEIAQAARSR
jgi:voltage-gated potassium channel